MTSDQQTIRPPRRPPRWVARVAWTVHRFLYRYGGRRFLARPERDGKFGMLLLRTVGRRTGQERAVILGYFEDGGNLVTLAMNGWQAGDPAWWLNLQAHPEAEAETVDGVLQVRGRAAVGDERDRLWATFDSYKGWGGDVDRFASLRPGETAVVILEPQA